MYHLIVSASYLLIPILNLECLGELWMQKRIAVKPIDTPKLTTGHFIALQREEIHLHLHRRQTWASVTRKPWQATSPTPLTGNSLHNKEETQTSSYKKATANSNLNQMKRQRNIQQVKEHDKCSPNQTKEEETESLPEREFRIMIVKIIQNLENKMEL